MKDKETLDRYQAHDLHTRLKEQYIAPVKENLIAVDYEY